MSINIFLEKMKVRNFQILFLPGSSAGGAGGATVAATGFAGVFSSSPPVEINLSSVMVGRKMSTAYQTRKLCFLQEVEKYDS
jgi:hypothetical protein